MLTETIRCCRCWARTAIYLGKNAMARGSEVREWHLQVKAVSEQRGAAGNPLSATLTSGG